MTFPQQIHFIATGNGETKIGYQDSRLEQCRDVECGSADRLDIEPFFDSSQHIGLFIHDTNIDPPRAQQFGD